MSRPRRGTSSGIAQVEFTLVTLNGLLPFPYPPPFLLMVTPFSLLSYMWGFAAWVERHGHHLLRGGPARHSGCRMCSPSRPL